MLKRAASAIQRIFRRRGEELAPEPVETVSAPTESAPRSASASTTASPSAARVTKRQSDIGVDVLSRTYIPPQASGKAGFRSDGADHQRDQEFASGSSDERWNDEDRITNKSRDPRIGTHGRTYEPDETRDRSQSE